MNVEFKITVNRPPPRKGCKKTVVSIFGTRPEAIKFGPILRHLSERSGDFNSKVLITSQQAHLLPQFLDDGGITPDAVAAIERTEGGLNEFLARAVEAIDAAIKPLKPDFVLVQGDTSSTLAGALVAFNDAIPVGHIEAGLRSGQRDDPFPEEMNRRLVTQLADLHFAATAGNRDALLAESVPDKRVYLTGNTIVDAVHHTLVHDSPSPEMSELLSRLEKSRILTVTSHRRENIGDKMRATLTSLRDFAIRHDDIALVFPVHPNPGVQAISQEVFQGCDRVNLIDPINHIDFLHLMNRSWLIASDSGGVQEEAVSLAKPLLVLRDTTERAEAITHGTAILTGTEPRRITAGLQSHYRKAHQKRNRAKQNPFGDGRAAERIVTAIAEWFAADPNDAQKNAPAHDLLKITP